MQRIAILLVLTIFLQFTNNAYPISQWRKDLISVSREECYQIINGCKTKNLKKCRFNKEQCERLMPKKALDEDNKKVAEIEKKMGWDQPSELSERVKKARDRFYKNWDEHSKKMDKSWEERRKRVMAALSNPSSLQYKPNTKEKAFDKKFNKVKSNVYAKKKNVKEDMKKMESIHKKFSDRLFAIINGDSKNTLKDIAKLPMDFIREVRALMKD